MKLQIHLVHHADAVKERLRRDGWRLEDESDDFVSAWHHEVASEREARARLHGLGLLTSGALRVEFPIRARLHAAVL